MSAVFVDDSFEVLYKDRLVGHYWRLSDGSCSYSVYSCDSEDLRNDLREYRLDKDRKTKRPMKPFSEIIREANRVPGRRQHIYVQGPITLCRIPNETGEKFWVYRRSAEKGEPGYEEGGKDHSAPHYEGPHTPEGMREWCSWYCFNKMDDGTFEAELDEAWWWGGGHNDGGTIRRPIPEEWFELGCDEFLERVVTLCAAKHYHFEAEDLRAKEGLLEFFGF